MVSDAAVPYTIGAPFPVLLTCSFSQTAHGLELILARRVDGPGWDDADGAGISDLLA